MDDLSVQVFSARPYTYVSLLLNRSHKERTTIIRNMRGGCLPVFLEPERAQHFHRMEITPEENKQSNPNLPSSLASKITPPAWPSLTGQEMKLLPSTPNPNPLPLQSQASPTDWPSLTGQEMKLLPSTPNSNPSPPSSSRRNPLPPQPQASPTDWPSLTGQEMKLPPSTPNSNPSPPSSSRRKPLPPGPQASPTDWPNLTGQKMKLPPSTPKERELEVTPHRHFATRYARKRGKRHLSMQSRQLSSFCHKGVKQSSVESPLSPSAMDISTPTSVSTISTTKSRPQESPDNSSAGSLSVAGEDNSSSSNRDTVKGGKLLCTQHTVAVPHRKFATRFAWKQQLCTQHKKLTSIYKAAAAQTSLESLFLSKTTNQAAKTVPTPSSVVEMRHDSKSKQTPGTLYNVDTAKHTHSASAATTGDTSLTRILC